MISQNSSGFTSCPRTFGFLAAMAVFTSDTVSASYGLSKFKDVGRLRARGVAFAAETWIVAMSRYREQDKQICGVTGLGWMGAAINPRASHGGRNLPFAVVLRSCRNRFRQFVLSSRHPPRPAESCTRAKSAATTCSAHAAHLSGSHQ